MRVNSAKETIFSICCLCLFKFHNFVTKWTSLFFWLPKQLLLTANIKIWTQDYKKEEIKKNKNPHNYNEKLVLGITASVKFLIFITILVSRMDSCCAIFSSCYHHCHNREWAKLQCLGYSVTCNSVGPCSDLLLFQSDEEAQLLTREDEALERWKGIQAWVAV